MKKLLTQETGKKIYLIFGANGMLGHKILQTLSKKKKFTYGTIRLKKNRKLNNNKIIYNVDVNNFRNIEKLIHQIKPNYVINCTGLIKQKLEVKRNDNFKKINFLFPLFLDRLSKKYLFRHIHFSTDCVFNGNKGNYTERSKKNAKDDYGKYKIAAENNIINNTLKIRTSIIGHEINKKKYSLLEWFLSSKNNVRGFKTAYFSGLTTLEISNIIYKIVNKKKFITGLYNIASNKISKYELIKKINKVYSLNKAVISDDTFKIDRSLNPKKFNDRFKININTWDVQIKNMYNDYIKNKEMYK